MRGPDDDEYEDDDLLLEYSQDYGGDYPYGYEGSRYKGIDIEEDF